MFSGDFRQILPVIPKGNRQDVVHATINSSYLWTHCVILKLTKNMRLQSSGNCHDVRELKDFSNWFCNIGDGKIDQENDGKIIVDFSHDVLVGASDNIIQSIVENTYPSFLENVCDVSHMQGKAILAPILDDVQAINDFMIFKNSCEERTYLSSNTICHTERVFGLFAEIIQPNF